MCINDEIFGVLQNWKAVLFTIQRQSEYPSLFFYAKQEKTGNLRIEQITKKEEKDILDYAKKEDGEFPEKKIEVESHAATVSDEWETCKECFRNIIKEELQSGICNDCKKINNEKRDSLNKWLPQETWICSICKEKKSIMDILCVKCGTLQQ